MLQIEEVHNKNGRIAHQLPQREFPMRGKIFYAHEDTFPFVVTETLEDSGQVTHLVTQAGLDESTSKQREVWRKSIIDPSTQFNEWKLIGSGKYGIVYVHYEQPIVSKHIYQNNQAPLHQNDSELNFFTPLANALASEIYYAEFGSDDFIPIHGLAIQTVPGHEDPQIYVFMPYVRGLNLDSLCYLEEGERRTKQEHIEEIQAADIDQSLADCLEYMSLNGYDTWLYNRIQQQLGQKRNDPRICDLLNDISFHNTLLTGLVDRNGVPVSVEDLKHDRIPLSQITPKFKLHDLGLNEPKRAHALA